MDQDDSGSSRRGSAASSSVRFERSGAVSPSSAATPAEDRADWPLGGGARRPSAFGPLRQARSTDWSSRRTSNAGLDRKNASSLAFAERRKSIPHFPYPFGAQQQQPPTPLSSAPSPRETAHRASFDHQQAPPPPASESPRIATFSLPRWRGNSRKTDLHTERATERLEVILDDDSGKVHWAGSPAGQACATGRHITFEPAQHVRVFEAGIEGAFTSLTLDVSVSLTSLSPVFAWTASGNSWLKGQIKSTPGCLWSVPLLPSLLGRIMLKENPQRLLVHQGRLCRRQRLQATQCHPRGTPLRAASQRRRSLTLKSCSVLQHIGTCPRILEDDPLAILCRFAREGDRLNTSLRGARKRQNASTGSDRPASPSTSA